MINPTTGPLRCPHCGALVVDRRSPACTTCRAELPAEWVMSREQVTTLARIEAQNRATHRAEMRVLDPLNDPNLPPLVRMLDQDVTGSF
ncbi:MAG: hypothetical protein WDO13_18105 [Verrucomicrobiota bacterium]